VILAQLERQMGKTRLVERKPCIERWLVDGEIREDVYGIAR